MVRLTDELDQRTRIGDLVGRSDCMRELFRTIERVARSTATVLIRGESGTGKELAARAIHELGPRSGGPFVAVNCAAIPANLMESELFGHERGAFTDARERRIGKFEAAAGGHPVPGRDRRAGPAAPGEAAAVAPRQASSSASGEPSPSRWTCGSSPQPTATWRRKSERGGSGTISTTGSTWFLSRFRPCESAATTSGCWPSASWTSPGERASLGPARFTREALAALERYHWPGNVRELENAIERAVALSDRDLIDVGDLPGNIARANRTESLREALRSGRIAFEEMVAAFEQDVLREVLDRCGWNQTRAAEQLGITRRLLKLKIDKHALTRD